jgi:hypothetical protein
MKINFEIISYFRSPRDVSVIRLQHFTLPFYPRIFNVIMSKNKHVLKFTEIAIAGEGKPSYSYP